MSRGHTGIDGLGIVEIGPPPADVIALGGGARVRSVRRHRPLVPREITGQGLELRVEPFVAQVRLEVETRAHHGTGGLESDVEDRKLVRGDASDRVVEDGGPSSGRLHHGPGQLDIGRREPAGGDLDQQRSLADGEPANARARNHIRPVGQGERIRSVLCGLHGEQLAGRHVDQGQGNAFDPLKIHEHTALYPALGGAG